MTDEPADSTEPEELSTAQFRLLVQRYLDHMTAGDVLVADEYVVMVKLWNTMGETADTDDELLASFHDTFFPEHLHRASDVLGAQLAKGMALYSPSHSLWLGGSPDDASRYRLTD